MPQTVSSGPEIAPDEVRGFSRDQLTLIDRERVARTLWQAAEQSAEKAMRARPARVLPGDVASHVINRLLQPTEATLDGLDVIRKATGVSSWIGTVVERHLKDLQTQEINAHTLAVQMTDEFNRRLRDTPLDVLIRAEQRQTLLAAIDRVRRMGEKAYTRAQAAIALDVEGLAARAVAKALDRDTKYVRFMAKQGRQLLAAAVNQVTDYDRAHVGLRPIESGLAIQLLPGDTTDPRRKVKRRPVFDKLTPRIRRVIEQLPRRQREVFTAAYVQKARLEQIAKQFRLKSPAATVNRAKQYFLREAKKSGVHLGHQAEPSGDASAPPGRSGATASSAKLI